MNILVTGANGQLGKELQRIVEEKGNGFADHTTTDKNYYIFAGHDDLDITKSEMVNDYISKHYINVIVNCAAYTNVNEAQINISPAYKSNLLGVGHLANAAKQNGCVLIHISTDFVFDGEKRQPYKPTDRINPLSNYGKSKFAGEEFLRQTGCRYLIFRTSWLYSALSKNNFVYKIYDKLINGEEKLNVVDDEVGCPTNARNLANFIYHIIEDNNAENRYLSKTGTYHFCDNNCTDRYLFARYIEQSIRQQGGCAGNSERICRSKSNKDSIRPRYSVLDTKTTTETFNWEMASGELSIENAVKEIIEKEKRKTNENNKKGIS